mgnify:FL=1
MKLVLILVLMIVSVMAVVGTFLINSVSTFYIDSFYTQMQSVFTTDTIRSMQEAAAAPDAEGLKTIIDAHRSRLGIDDYRNYYILDGEGRFVAPQNVLDQLVANGQVATQYVDLEGEPTMDQRYNPNGSLLAIEGITSPDGRVFGKMGHSERSGEYLYKNVTGDKYQPIFEGGVDYFKV